MNSEKAETRLYGVMTIVLLGLLVTGVAAELTVGDWSSLGRRVWDVQTHPARLLNDYTSGVGEGAALINAALVAFIGLVVVAINDIRLSGPTVAAVFTMFGFGLFGKTPLNILPILAGVWIAARVAGQRFKDYILIGLFGTALAPLVSLLAVEMSLPGVAPLFSAILAGTLAGVLLPAVAMVMLRLHQGYNLYNIGLTAGFIALFAAAVAFGNGDQLPGGSVWNESPSMVLQLLIPAVSVVLILAGLFGNAPDNPGGAGALRGFLRITRLSGRLPSDFMETEGINGSLINMGILGLLAWGYVVLVGSVFNGPVLGGIFTVIGFASFGKHPKNVWPVVAGVAIAALVFGRELSAPGVILAALFGTTLAPLAGDFGVVVGMIAGFLHLSIVMRSGAWHAGIDLYNNGFAGGLTATLLVAVIEWYRANRPSDRSTHNKASASTE